MLDILFTVIVELARHDQLAIGGLPIGFELRPRIEQQVKTFIVADNTEKERIFNRWIESQLCARLLLRHRLAEIDKQRVGREECGFGGSELIEIVLHLLRHIDKAIDAIDEIGGAGAVDQMVFVRNHIVDLHQHLGMTVTARNACNRTKAGSHKRCPILHQHHIGALTTNTASDLDPIQRIDRTDTTLNIEILGRRTIGILRLAREQKFGILQREGLDIDLRTASRKRACHNLHNRRQATTIGVRRT